MRDHPTSSALRRALRLDAGASGAMGLLLTVDAGMLHPLLGIPAPLLRWSGLFLLPFAAFLLVLAPRAGAMTRVVRAVVAGNVLWILASVASIVVLRSTLTPLGELFVLAQAAAVALFVVLEARALRGSAGRAVSESVSW